MNMSIKAPSATNASASTGNSAASESQSTTAGGFAGALVQAVQSPGTETAATSGNSVSLPTVLAGLLGQFGLVEEAAGEEELKALLAKLVEMLQQLDNGEELSSEVQDQLAGLLAALQQVPVLTVAEVDGSTIAAHAIGGAQASAATGGSVVTALIERLQLLSGAMSNGGNTDTAAVKTLAAQLQVVLEDLQQLQQTQASRSADADNGQTSQAQAVNVAVNANDKAEARKSTDKIAEAAANENAADQTAATSSEQRRPLHAMRDQAWRFQSILQSQADEGSGNQTALVAQVGTTTEAGQAVSAVSADSAVDQGSAFKAETAAAGTTANDAASAKPALPAQVPVQQFSQQMEKYLVKQFLLTQGNGVSEAKITLHPEHLGQVDIRIMMQNGQLTAQFMTDNPIARDMLENQMSQLRTMLDGQGLKVERLEVVQQPSASANTAFMHQEQRNSGSGNNGGSGNRDKNGSYDDSVFEVELERSSSLRQVGYGSSLNVTA